MKKHIINALLGIAFIVFCIQFIYSANEKQKNVGQGADLGPGYKVAPGHMKKFYDLFGKGLHKMVDDHDYDAAEMILKDALQYAEVQPEAAMVHRQLAIIYRQRDDHPSEIESLKTVARYTMNSDVRRQSLARVEELLSSTGILDAAPSQGAKQLPDDVLQD